MSTVVEFVVYGPFDVPLDPVHRDVDPVAARAIWRMAPLQTLAEKRGCYVFALSKPGPGVQPAYVGKTNASFRQECFNARNRNLLDRRLRREIGKPVFFLLEYQQRQGRLNRTAIDRLEKQLIEIALNRNPDLWNVHGARRQVIVRVRGVLNAERGKPSKAAAQFRRVLGL